MKELAFLFVVNNFEREHLGIMQIAACLRQEMIPSYSSDADFLKIREKLMFLRAEYRQVIIAYSVPTVFAHLFLSINRELKKRYDFISLFGGPHPTFFPQMIEEEGVDIICIGEGEKAALELANNIINGSSFEKIMNLYVKNGSIIHKNPLRPLLKELDALPFPDRNLFRRGNKRTNQNNMIITASRGCPFSCSYCFNAAFRKLYNITATDIIRRRSVDNVISEINACREKYDIQFISFVDSIFTSDPAWLAEFSEKYIKGVGIPFYCNVYPGFINNDSTMLLARTGCSVIGMGVECGDEKTRFDVLKREMTDKKLKEAAETIKRHKIILSTGNILGIPGAGIEEDLKTLRFNIDCRTDYAMTYLMSLHPGTDIYGQAEQLGQIEETSASYYNGVHWSKMKRFSSSLEKRMTINLQNLFGFVVAHPRLYPLVCILIRLPLTKLYYFVHIFYEGLATFPYKRHKKHIFRRILTHILLILNRLKYYATINSIR